MNPQSSNDVASQKIPNLKESIRNNEKRLTDFQQRIADLKALVESRHDRNQNIPAPSFPTKSGSPHADRDEQR